jgi:RNA polymerase sigma factor (sigma-70 family)
MNPERCAGDAVSTADQEPDSSGEWGTQIDALYRERADNLIRRLTPAADRETASDVVHEAFARFSALTGTRRLIIARPDAYLYRICVNLIRDLARSRQVHAQAIADPSLAAEAWQNPVVQLEQRDELRRLEAAMLRLKPKTREIFLAKRLDGLTYAEIAERTGLSVKGVEKHMAKAIARVERTLDRGRP